MPGQRFQVGDANIRQAVGEQQGPVERALRSSRGGFLATRQPAAAQVGGSPGMDVLDQALEFLAILAGAVDAGRQDLDLIIIGDDGHLVPFL
jgi:hypothetical protein